MTFHYRIYTFENSLGETVFRAKHVGWLPAWATPWVVGPICYGTGLWDYSKWGHRDGVMEAIREDAKERDSKVRASKRKALKLVVVEDVPVEVS